MYSWMSQAFFQVFETIRVLSGFMFLFPMAESLVSTSLRRKPVPQGINVRFSDKSIIEFLIALSKPDVFSDLEGNLSVCFKIKI